MAKIRVLIYTINKHSDLGLNWYFLAFWDCAIVRNLRESNNAETLPLAKRCHMWDWILYRFEEWRSSVVHNPAVLPILADAIADIGGSLATEAETMIRYWWDVRTNVRMFKNSRERIQWECWYKKVIQKYGPETKAVPNNHYSHLVDRLGPYFMEVEFVDYPDPSVFEREPIMTMTVRNPGYNFARFLFENTLPNVEILNLDILEQPWAGRWIIYILEHMIQTGLRRVNIIGDNDNRIQLKGRASICLMSNTHIPKGVQLWWNNEPA